MFEDRLKILRINMKKSQAQVAKDLGIPQKTYCNYERNEREPSANMLIKIAKYFNVTLDELLGYQAPTAEERKELHLQKLAEASVMEDIAINMGLGLAHPLSKLTQMRCVDIIKLVRWSEDHFITDTVHSCDFSALCLLDEERVESNALETSYYYFEVADDQMAPFIENGDYVLVNGDSEIKSGDIAIVAIGERNGVIREVEIDDYEIIIKSRNPYYPPISFTGESREQIHFAGRVERIIRLL